MRKRLENYKGHYVYYLFTYIDGLIYIGYSNYLLQRIGSHRRKIDYDYVEYEEFNNKFEAMSYEWREILKNRPKYNKIRQITIDNVKDWDNKMKIIYKSKL